MIKYSTVIICWDFIKNGNTATVAFHVMGIFMMERGVGETTGNPKLIHISVLFRLHMNNLNNRGRSNR